MEDLKVLVLNADFIPLNLVPISTIHWQKAFKLIFEDLAVAVKYYEDKIVHTTHEEFLVPSVIVLKEYKYFKKYAKWSKFNIKLRDEFHCQYCGNRFSSRALTIDHVHPKAHGGKHSWKNSVAACKRCNQRKKDHKHIKPLRQPYRPTYFELAKKMLNYKSIMNPDWTVYVKHLESK